MIASGGSVAPARPAIVGTHRRERRRHPAHRPAAQRGVAVEDGEAGEAGEDPGREAEGGPGVLAVEDAGRLAEARPAGRDDPVVDRSRIVSGTLDDRAEGRDDVGGRPHVAPVAGAGDAALARRRAAPGGARGG